MRNVLSVTCLLILFSHGENLLAENPASRHLILVAGQSNAVGFDAKATELPPDSSDAKVPFWFRTGDPPPDEADSSSGGKWTTLKPQARGKPNPKKSAPRQYGNFAQAGGGFGPEIGLCRHLQKAEPGKSLAVVKVAFSGTSVPRDWDPDGDEPSSSCYRALVSETRKAIAAAQKIDLELTLRALVWVQGESDAKADRVAQYEANLTKMITRLREDLRAPNLIVALAVNTQFGKGKNQLVPEIVAAQKALAGKDPRTMYVDTSAATIANGAHYDTRGTLDVGRWFAEAILQHEAAVSVQ